MAEPKTLLKVLRAAIPGDTFYTTASQSHISVLARREGIEYNVEKVLIIENYKTEQPTVIKVVKVTLR
jgi:hypothetical protein